MPVDAERWLADRGVPREPVATPEPPDAGAVQAPPPSPAEVRDLARQAAADAPPSPAGTPDAEPAGGTDPASTATRADDVDAALAFIRRSTANAPQSEGRLREKLADRGHDETTVDDALGRANDAGLVDDDALLEALIAERRARGHADRRLRRDLRDRGFTGPQVDDALARHAHADPAAAAFEVARAHAARNRGVDAEAAVRRTVGALVRRGHGEALARKAARDAVYADREDRAAAER